MSDALYHEALVALARARSGAGRLEPPGAAVTRDNPMCGDQVTVEVRVASGVVAALAHRVRGCVLCEAAASLLGRAAPGRTAAEIAAAREGVAALLQRGAPPPDGAFHEVAVFTPVGAVPSRHGCVLLPFDALREALAAAG